MRRICYICRHTPSARARQQPTGLTPPPALSKVAVWQRARTPLRRQQARHVLFPGKNRGRAPRAAGSSGAQAGVPSDLPGGQMYLGAPAMPRLEFGKSLAHVAGIPKLKEKLKALEARLAALERGGA